MEPPNPLRGTSSGHPASRGPSAASAEASTGSRRRPRLRGTGRTPRRGKPRRGRQGVIGVSGPVVYPPDDGESSRGDDPRHAARPPLPDRPRLHRPRRLPDRVRLRLRRSDRRRAARGEPPPRARPSSRRSSSRLVRRLRRLARLRAVRRGLHLPGRGVGDGLRGDRAAGRVFLDPVESARGGAARARPPDADAERLRPRRQRSRTRSSTASATSTSSRAGRASSGASRSRRRLTRARR